MSTQANHGHSAGSGPRRIILSIDGGGIRGLSSLFIIRQILQRIQQMKSLPSPPLADEVFQMAGGTGTGGLIVIMLFRLRMPIDAAIRAYVQIGKRVFSKKDRSPELESAVVRILSLEKKTLMWEPEFSRLTNSKAFVCAGRKSNVANPIHFPTWESKDQKFKRVNCTIVEAICATCATPNIFQDTPITEEPQADTRPIQYTGADLRWNNPVLDVWEEAKAAFTSSNISHIVSIGTGATEIVERHSDLSKTLMDIAKDCEKEYEEAARLLLEEVPRLKFIRLNVEQGLQTMEWETQEYGDIKVHTEAYLQEKEVDKKLDDIVTAHLEAAK